MSVAVYLVGLDGATWDLLDSLMAAGFLPRLQSLVGQGVRSTLASTYPPVTALAWPSFYTGQNPGKHGVFSFVRRDAEGRERIVDARSVQTPALWDWVSAVGLRVGVVGVPVTYPARSVNGFMISGFLTPPAGMPACYPSDLLTSLDRDLGPWRFHVPPVEGAPTMIETERFVAGLMAATEQRITALQRLLDRFDPDLFVTVWMHPDTIQHSYWGYLHPEHPFYTHPEAPALRQALRPAFLQLDAAIGALADRVLPEGALVLMSDHGFGPMNRRIAVNNALARLGYLRLRKVRLLADRVRRRLRRRLGWTAASDWQRHVQRHPGQNRYIDWRHTRAFAGAAHELCVHLYRADRYPAGIVKPDEVATLRREIAEALLDLVDADGAPLFAAVDPPEALYHGPFIERAPDLLLRPADPRDVVTDGILRGNRLYRDETGHARGWHRLQGIMLAVGQGIRVPAAWTAPPSLLDLAPTALHLLGLQPPEGLDGRVLTEMMVQQAPPLRSIPTTSMASVAGELSADEEQSLTERLRGLGYLA